MSTQFSEVVWQPAGAVYTTICSDKLHGIFIKINNAFLRLISVSSVQVLHHRYLSFVLQSHTKYCPTSSKEYIHLVQINLL